MNNPPPPPTYPPCHLIFPWAIPNLFHTCHIFLLTFLLFLFPLFIQVDENNLAAVDANDVAIIKAARVTAENAETETGGFNDAIAAASGTAADALQVGKIKNKVLKLKLEVLGLQIDQAQSGTDNTAKIAAEQKKLDTNIATDTKSAGQTSQAVTFTGDDQPSN